MQNYFGVELVKIKNLLFDVFLILFSIVGIGLLKPDLFLIIIYLFIFPYLIFSKRKNAFLHFFLSSFIAVIWLIIANDMYGYNQPMLLFYGLNSFPLFAWALGLFGVYLLYSHFENKIKAKHFIKRLFLFLFIYWSLLLILEFVSYYFFDIRNLATSMYSGLSICNCMHAPLWMQISYFLLGPIYFIICKCVGLENPHNFEEIKSRQFNTKEIKSEKLNKKSISKPSLGL
jgi:hypothetical protein